MVRLGDVCKIISGYAFKSEEFIIDGVPVIRISNLDGETVNVDKNICYSVEFLKNNDNFIVRKNDILMAMSGATVGKIGVYPNEYVALLNQRVCNLKPVEDKLNREYLNCYCQSDYFKSEILKNAFGCAQPNISVKQIADFEIKILDLKSQVRIANKLKNILCLIEKRKLQLQKLNELIKARFVEMFGDIANCSKYDGIALGTICTTLSGGTPTTKVPEYYEGEIPWISTPYLGSNHIDGSSAKAYITEEAIENSATHLIPANTILFGIRVGVGKSSVIDVSMCANQDIVALMGIDTTKFNLIFLKHVLDSYQNHFDSIKKGATILGITTDDLKKVLVPTVGIELQNQFATFVEQIDKSKLNVQKSLEKLETLKKALMQKYFG